MSAQIITKDGKDYAVLPYEDYERLLELAEDAEDARSLEAAKGIREELVPHAVVRRLVEGENPVKVWREHRGLSQEALAAAAGTGQSTIAMLESGERTGRVGTLKKIAAALSVDLDDVTAS